MRNVDPLTYIALSGWWRRSIAREIHPSPLILTTVIPWDIPSGAHLINCQQNRTYCTPEFWWIPPRWFDPAEGIDSNLVKAFPGMSSKGGVEIDNGLVCCIATWSLMKPLMNLIAKEAEYRSTFSPTLQGYLDVVSGIYADRWSPSVHRTFYLLLLSPSSTYGDFASRSHLAQASTVELYDRYVTDL